MRLDASLLDRVLVIASPAIVLGLGAWGVSGGGMSSVGGVLVVVGAVLLAVAGWVMPWSTVIDEHGISRRTLLRTHRIDWDDVVAVERAGRGRRGVVSRSLGGLTHSVDRHHGAAAPVQGGSRDGDQTRGLVVRTVERRRHVLGTKAERPDEWDRLKELLAEHAPGVAPPAPPALHPFNRR